MTRTLFLCYEHNIQQSKIFHQPQGRDQRGVGAFLPHTLGPRQGGAFHPRRELHRFLLLAHLRKERHRHVGDAAD